VDGKQPKKHFFFEKFFSPDFLPSKTPVFIVLVYEMGRKNGGEEEERIFFCEK